MSTILLMNAEAATADPLDAAFLPQVARARDAGARQMSGGRPFINPILSAGCAAHRIIERDHDQHR